MCRMFFSNFSKIYCFMYNLVEVGYIFFKYAFSRFFITEAAHIFASRKCAKKNQFKLPSFSRRNVRDRPSTKSQSKRCRKLQIPPANIQNGRYVFPYETPATRTYDAWHLDSATPPFPRGPSPRIPRRTGNAAVRPSVRPSGGRRSFQRLPR